MENKNKLDFAGLVIIAIGLLTIFIPVILYNFYSPELSVGPAGNSVTWRDNELKMPLDTMKNIIGIGSMISLAGIIIMVSVRFRQLKSKDGFAIGLIVLSSLTAAGILIKFLPCMDIMPNGRWFTCYWSARILFSICAMIAATGFLMLFNWKSEGVVKGLSFAAVTLSALVILIPTSMIGNCADAINLYKDTLLASKPRALAACHGQFKPFSILMGSALLMLSIINVVFMRVESKIKNKFNFFALITLAFGLFIVFTPIVIFQVYDPARSFSAVFENETMAWHEGELRITLDSLRFIVRIGAGFTITGMIMLLFSRLRQFSFKDGFSFGFIILAIAATGGILLESFFPCFNLMRSPRPMVCQETMKAIFGVYAAISSLAYLTLIDWKTKDVGKGISFVIMLLSVLPLLLIKVISQICVGQTMRCHQGFEAFVTAIGCLLIVVSLTFIILLHIRKEKEL